MKLSKHRLTVSGIFFSGIFLAGALIQLFSSRMIGQGDTFFEAITNPTVLSIFFIFLVFVSSTLFKQLAILQPFILLIVFIIPIQQSHESFQGMALYISGFILLYKGGYLDKHRFIKVILLIIYLYGIELWVTISKNGFVPYAFSAVFFITAFLAFLYLMFKDQVIVYLQADKPTLSLSAKGLVGNEVAFVLAFAAGKSQKEIALDAQVTDSTVRNTLARTYKKLGVADKATLASLLTSHEIVN